MRFSNKITIPLAIIIGFIILGLMTSGDDVADQTYVPATEQPAEVSAPVTENKEPVDNAANNKQTAVVSFVVDGDTVEISTGERVRLLGIDAPEKGNPYYTESRNKLSELVFNKTVTMEKDITDKDRYSRLLRYLYVGSSLINLEMVKQGYASVYTYPPDVKYNDVLLSTEREAKTKQVGLWAPVEKPTSKSTPPTTITSFTLPGCASTDCDCGDFSTHAYAQWFHENHNPGDKHKLDRDDDGLACETLP